MRRVFYGLFILLIVQFLGCAGFLSRPGMPPLAEQCQLKALEFEKTGELQKALYHWIIVRDLAPDNKKADGNIERLKESIAQQTDRHLKDGKALLKKGLFDAAHQEFLISLRYDPSNRKALDYLKTGIPKKGFVIYRVKQGDTPKKIAKKVYKDADMEFLVAYFLHADKKSRSTRGTVLSLPYLNLKLKPKLETSKPVVYDINAKLAEARSLFKVKEYEKLFGVLQDVLVHEPQNKEAVEMQNDSFFRMGKRLALKGEHLASLNMYKRVAPGYEGLKEAITEAENRIAKQTEMHYRKGVRHFLNEELEKAIEEWEKALVLNPAHGKAKSDIKDARKLLEKLRQIK